MGLSWRPWTPGRGDIVSVRMTEGKDATAPDACESPPRRPGLVLSPAEYSAKVGLVVLCPVAAESSGYPFEVELPFGLPVSGAVLADRVT